MNKIIFPSTIRIRVKKQFYLLMMAIALACAFALIGVILKTIGV